MTDRRSFLRGSSVLLGHAALAQVLTAFAATPRKATFFPERAMQALRAVVDVILPKTDSPAASEADTHYFIDLAVCASQQALATFNAGLQSLIDADFAAMSPQQQIALLQRLAGGDSEKPYDQAFFKILKDYTLTGYFLSETGATRALAYEKIPGGYWGDLPLTPNQKAWAI
jgi:hypothetical protein